MNPKQLAEWEALCLEHIETRQIIKLRNAEELDRHTTLARLRYHYKKKTKERLSNYIFSVYWDSLLAYVADDPKEARRRIVKKLDINPTTLYRWKHGSGFPDAATFFAILTAFKIPLRELPVPSHDDVITTAMCRGVEYIRERELTRPQKSLSPDDYVRINLVYKLPNSHSLVVPMRNDSDTVLRKSLVTEAREILSRHFPKVSITEERIKELIHTYLVAYALLDFGRPLKWDFLNEIATRATAGLPRRER